MANIDLYNGHKLFAATAVVVLSHCNHCCSAPSVLVRGTLIFLPLHRSEASETRAAAR